MSAPTIEVVHGDALGYRADVLALKFAQATYGVDDAVVARLEQRNMNIRRQLPAIGRFLFLPSSEVVAAREILFVGVESIGRFDYGTIREFSRRVLSVLAAERPEVAHMAMTLHGRGFGLDEAEAFRAELAGVLDAIHDGQVPARLRKVTFVERDQGAARRIASILSEIAAGGRAVERAAAAGGLGGMPAELATVGRNSMTKPLVFVAMPFADEYADRFHYGIQGAANAAGFLCERADLASFTGDVVQWVKERIDSAALVVADLTSANPNVYLEVGYAWGRGVNTVLVVATGDELKFDVRTQRCLVFNSIRHLEELLTRELQALAR